MAYISMGEAHRRITDFLNRFSDAVSSQDAKSLSLIFSISSTPSFLAAVSDALITFQVTFLFLALISLPPPFKFWTFIELSVFRDFLKKFTFAHSIPRQSSKVRFYCGVIVETLNSRMYLKSSTCMN